MTPGEWTTSTEDTPSFFGGNQERIIPHVFSWVLSFLFLAVGQKILLDVKGSIC